MKAGHHLGYLQPLRNMRNSGGKIDDDCRMPVLTCNSMDGHCK